MFPGLRYEDGVAEAIALCALREELDAAHVQLCPQSWGAVDAGLAERLQDRHPHTAFRLHSNLRTRAGTQEVTAADDDAGAWERLAVFDELSACFGATVYSLHAGSRRQMALPEMFDNLRRMNDEFEVTVAVEGMYPHPRQAFLLDCWSDYEALLEAAVPFALDLSHLNIVACREQRQDLDLTRALLASPHCLEVHLSANSGRADQHRPLDGTRSEWWWAGLDGLHDAAIVFAEENQGVVRRRQRP